MTSVGAGLQKSLIFTMGYRPGARGKINFVAAVREPLGSQAALEPSTKEAVGESLGSTAARTPTGKLPPGMLMQCYAHAMPSRAELNPSRSKPTQTRRNATYRMNFVGAVLQIIKLLF